MAFKLLVVDDDAVFRINLSERLRREGYNVREAGTGQGAVLQLNTDTFDLILTDLKLPDVSGLDLVKKVREMKTDTRVIILTGHADVASAIEALRYGADEFIEKGAGLDNTIEHINSTLQKLKDNRELVSVGEQYKTIIENLNDAVGAVDAEGRITYISSSIKKILGYEPEEMIGHHFLDFVVPADKESVAGRVSHFTENGSPSVNTNRLLSKEGNIVWIRFSDSPVKKDRNPEAFYTVLTDVTTTKNLQDELIKKESRALAGELAAFVAHDINTPLQGVLSILEHCRSEHEENKELLEYITLMRSGLLKIKGTVLNLLELENPIIYDTTDVNLYLHKVIHLAESYLRSYGIQVEMQLASDMPEALISTKDFEQLLLGIIREEVKWFGREDWDIYPALSVFETGKRITANRPEQGGEVLFQHRKWKIESRWEDGIVYIKFHNLDWENVDEENSPDKFSILNSVIQENNCTIRIESIPGKEKYLIIGIPGVIDA